MSSGKIPAGGNPFISAIGVVLITFILIYVCTSANKPRTPTHVPKPTPTMTATRTR